MSKKLRIDLNVALSAAIILLLVPVKWSVSWLIAAAIHELFHCIGVWLCGGRILSVHVSASGAKITTDLSGPGQEIFCLLIGPVGGGLLLLLSVRFPRVALCALLQSAYNLLPLPDLDGGQAVKGIADLLFAPCIAQKICAVLQKLTVWVVILLCVFCCVILRLGILPIVFAVFFLVRYRKIKIPCKECRQAVQ